MNRAILDVVEALSNKRGVGEEVIFQAIEAALASVTERRYGPEGEAAARVVIDRKTGDYESFRMWTVVADDENDPLEFPSKQLTLEQAHKIDPTLQVGDLVEEPIESEQFDRIAVQHAKNVIMQKVREAERAKIAADYQARVGSLLTGQAKRVTREYVILDMGDQAEALLTREEMIPREAFRMGDRIRVYLYAVRDERRGPQLLVSRTHPNMLVELFKIEVPEIGEQVIQIRACARDPGSRAKIAVKTNDGRIDPIGACVGMRGSRVQAVSNELGGERIDIVLWDDNPAQLVINAMAPAEVASIVVEEETHSMDVAVKPESLSQAIGRSGQNVRLASELTGWTLNVMSEEEALQKTAKEAEKIKQTFIEKLDIDEDIAGALVDANFTTIEEIAYVSPEEMSAIEGFDEEIVAELQNRAKDVMLAQEIVSHEKRQPAEDLLGLEGMTEELAEILAQHEIISRDDLAEQSIDELMEIVDIDEQAAAKLIMKAREHWFV